MGRQSYGKFTLTGYSSFLDDAYIRERETKLTLLSGLTKSDDS